MKAKSLTKQEFIDKIANYEVSPNEWNFLGSRPALVDFYATWCGPCKMLAPVLDELSEEYAGKVDIYKVNVEEEEELSALFSIRSVPSLLFIPMNGKPQLAAGAMPKIELKNVIENILLNGK
ncbi:MAG: thioredoxin [Prevotellaceae bacterium]|nr:thioredoxin [Prevotellaceae bacterium]